ncbi:orexin/Hypocretin receptor type 1 [Nematostella vectensis]|uniref:orexin/Hypocretin receptor type 1 n=1 Tax=Nematostella vectensis TaxID=45351 RepID=UPI0020775469|nr:orexin/Hypocretin receptor type 1 [Nematostella vectensis]
MRYFVMSLASSDILASLVSLPLTISQVKGWLNIETDLACKVVRYVGIVGPAITMINLLVMGLERYACAFHPLKVPSRRTVARCVVAVWLTGLVLSLLPAIAHNTIPVDIDDESYTMLCRPDPTHKFLFLGFSVCVYILPCIVLTVTSLAIARLLRRKSKQVLSENQPMPREQAWRFDGSKMLISVTFAIVLPYFAYVTYINITLFWKIPFDFATDRLIRFTMALLIYANGLCNVVIYFVYMKSLRKALVKMFYIKTTPATEKGPSRDTNPISE